MVPLRPQDTFHFFILEKRKVVKTCRQIFNQNLHFMFVERSKPYKNEILLLYINPSLCIIANQCKHKERVISAVPKINEKT